MKSEAKNYCCCCGYLTIVRRGDYEICPICFWEDDLTQLQFPQKAGGANKVSLVDAQKNYERIGVSDERLSKHVRKPSHDEKRSSNWKPIGIV